MPLQPAPPTCTEGKMVSDVYETWKGLEDAKKGFEEWLLLELMHLQRHEHLMAKFKHKCNIYEEWSGDKELMLESTYFNHAKLHKLIALD